MVSKNRLKFIKSLKIKKYRQLERSFLVEGRKNVLELVRSDFEIQCILGSNKFLEGHKKELSRVSEHEIYEVSPAVLTDVGTFQTNEDCLAVASFVQEDEHIEITRPTFVLDGVGDPGNLGTIIRTLDWFGHDALICSTDTAEFYNPKVINSTMGSFTRLKPQYVDLPKFLSSSEIDIYGADLDGISPKDCDFSKPCLIVMGSESHGISEQVQKLLTQKVSIPGSETAESLNVAMATGILAYEAFK